MQAEEAGNPGPATLRQHFQTYIGLCQQYPGAVPWADRARYFVPWARSLKQERSPIADQRIWVVFAAKGFLDRVVRRGMRVFEYGMGGSTLYFLSGGCDLSSVDHHADWYETVAASVKSHGYKTWHWCLREADAQNYQPPQKWPCNYLSWFGEYAKRTFHEYATVINQFADGSFDLVLIDGRARDSCFVHAHPKVKPGGWLVLDNSERERYRGIHDIMKQMGWRKYRFFGPGPYVKHEFWETTIWQRP
jgi:tRNA A58 N-methylase Trm61